METRASARGTGRFAPLIVTAVVSAMLAEPKFVAAEEAAARTEAASERREGAIPFNIAAQPLDAALAAFGAATGVHILYDSSLTAGLRSAPVAGNFTAREALARLLAWTGLTPRFTGARTATLQRNAGADSRAQAVPGTIVLEPITVLGEKAARDYFRTYTSVGVVTGREINDFNIPDLKRSFDLLGNVRSFPANRGNNGFVIRGLNSEGVTQPTNSAPIISVVIDGAIQNGEATRRGARGIWDVEQIEVLRGPQSTLQGRNSLGGSVVIKTKDPTWRPEFIFDGQLGMDQFKSGAFVLSGPIVPNQVAVRVSGQGFRETKDITYSDPTIASLGKDEFEQIRSKLLITPDAIPGLTALFTVSRTRDKPAVNAVTGPDFFARRFDATGSFVEFRKTFVNNYISDISYEMAPGWKLHSVTAYADTDTKIGTPEGASFLRADTRAGGDFSQDLRLVINPPDSALSGVLGLFAGRFTNDTNSFISTTAFGPSITIQDLESQNTTTSVAAYADLRYRIFDRWTLIGGGRVLRDKVENKINAQVFDFGTFQLVPLVEDVAASNTIFLPKVGIAYDITADQTLAATLNRGYRAGFAEAIVGSTAANTVAPEFLWSYELAYRSRWLDDRLQVNGNVFYYDYRNQQVVIDNPLIPSGNITQNAGKSHLYGAEIEARARVFDNLTLIASVGFLKTQFDEAVTTIGDFSGNQFPESPTITASLGGIWKHESGFFAAADVSYTDGYYSAGDLSNDPLRLVRSFTVLNARVGYEGQHGTVSVFARNLLNEKYLTSIAEGYNEATIGDGLLVGVRGTARF